MALKLNKRQQAHNVAMSILRNLSSYANSISGLLKSGTDDRGQKLDCSPDEISKAFSPDQLAAVESFIDSFAEVPEAPKAPVTPKGRRKPLHALPSEQ